MVMKSENSQGIFALILFETESMRKKVIIEDLWSYGGLLWIALSKITGLDLKSNTLGLTYLT